MIKHIKEIASLERWEDDIIALDGPEWDEDLKAETLIHRKMREEAAIIIQGCVDKAKHGSKMDAVLDRDVKNNAQALLRRLDSFFALGTADGDVVAAGKNLRNCTMRSSNLCVVEYGLQLEKYEKVLNIMGVYTNEKKELIQIYLKGLAITFKDIRSKIMCDMEPNYMGVVTWDPSLMDVKKIVELRAVREGFQDIKAGSKQVDQNAQQATKKTTATNATKKKQANVTKQQKLITNLKAQLVAAKGPQATTKATSGPPKMCAHGAKCWLDPCKFTHAKGHKPAPDPSTLLCTSCNRNGHLAPQCGKCFKCNSTAHSWKNCPQRTSNVSQNHQEIIRGGDNGGPSIEQDDGGVLLRL
jgi:hypothetical protein